MANGDKSAVSSSGKFALTFTNSEMTTLVTALEMFIASVKRAMTKETNPEVMKLREKQLQDLRALSNAIAYGGKELV